jgi:LPS O-antigen subunit length determinant protein (WzzB/FepE family)
LSPIEVPTDIVRRPALRRILRSTQIDALSKTSMEFIEGEKNFNKILCRLSAILHQDDPRYLDLSFDRTPTQIKKYKEDTEAAKAAAVALTSAKNETVIDDLDPKELAEKVKETIRIIPQEKEEETMTEQEEGVDVEARSIVKRVKELLLVL